jgi:acyl carrier protein
MNDAKKLGIKDELKKFIINNYLLGAKNAKISDDDSFLEEGIIDSIGVIELTNHIQRTCGIKIHVAEIVPQNFDTLNNLEKYINRKLHSK